MRLLSAADMHISDAASCRVALECFERALRQFRPDVVACLGDLFDNRTFLEQFGPEFHRQLRALHPDWLFVFGNHDGSGNSRGQNDDGWRTFCDLFGPAQYTREIGGHHFVVLANVQSDSGWQEFADAETRAGSVVLAHRPLDAATIERCAGRGARLILAGDAHSFKISRSADDSCEQRVQPPFLFGGRLGDAAGFNVIDFDDDGYSCQWVTQTLPAMPGNSRVAENAWQPRWRTKSESNLPELAEWCDVEPCRSDEYLWFGGAARLQCYRSGVLHWERNYGHSFGDMCPPVHVRHGEPSFLIIGGTWVPAPSGTFASVIVVDPFTGDEFYRVPVIGVSQSPTVVDGVMYIVGQWREIIAVDVATGRELWRRRSQVETPVTADLSWHDCRTGGGWSVCAPAVAKHVWTVNARGDLFGYDRHSGHERFVYPMAVPLNAAPTCPFANRLACAPKAFLIAEQTHGGVVFSVNGQRINDSTGELLTASR